MTRLDQLIARTIRSEISGERVEPDKREIVRMVGVYENGMCLPKSKEAYSCETYLETLRYYVKDIHCDSVTKNIGFTKEIVLDEICSKQMPLP